MSMIKASMNFMFFKPLFLGPIDFKLDLRFGGRFIELDFVLVKVDVVFVTSCCMGNCY